MEKVFDKLKRQQMENVEALNGLWQEFLCGLMAEPEEKPAESDGKARITELETMVNSIARELSEIMGTAE